MKYTEMNIRAFEIHMLALNVIQKNSKVLELGCATGYFSKELKKKGCSIFGIDIDKSAIEKAKRWCDHVMWGDLEQASEIKLQEQFDYVLLMDVIEHIKNRQELLLSIQRWLKDNGMLILTTPNIAHISIRIHLLFGNFNYTTWGILDETHVHFFTKKTLIELLKKNYSIQKIMASADFGQLPFIGRFARYVPKSIQFFITQLFPSLLGVQWFVIAKKYP